MVFTYLFNSFYVYGRLTHYAYNSDQKYEYSVH
ncbi:hypothetical protein CGLO_14446 [Colletotrichum gloeosporioides Cg-14]|uniref:Uncharacterized protein n=1 Tax=Colletotrichum gloeosporioides (strain Cg-14) TaxID=1237896 RepID=T0JUA0_COLGC|nr:hypothetical protein CGLO_14446 [Colletotrichum gloeosporioides Cg-14]